jgi:tRNA A-37 threonylcarbamoyl transferase component Bud32
MENPTRCPRCGTELTAGTPEKLCPRCLLLAGLESQGVKAASPPTAVYVPGFAAPTPEELGRLFPQLEILELLGKGGMGAVYKARQRGLDRHVALKILPPEVGIDNAFSERFTREAKALAQLNHPNIVGVFDSGNVNGLYFFLMEYVDGVNLRQALRAGNLKPAEALKIVPQICDALQFAHDEGVVHRDIKPENILLDKRGRVKIADFGLAKLFKAKTDEALTGTHQIMGTPHYMAPEQIRGTRDVDHRADIYSLGVTFYEMLTGELPLGRFAPPSKKVHIDVRLDEVVLRTLEVEPEKRYQHAGDVKTEVDQIVSTSGETKSHEAPRVHTDSLERVIADLLPDDKVAAVRVYRDATGAGLAEAMSAVKTIADKHGKNKSLPAVTPELIIRCLIGAIGFVFGGLWLAETQTWPANQLMFEWGGVILALFWVGQNYTAHVRKSRWKLADLEDSKPKKKPAPPERETPPRSRAFLLFRIPWRGLFRFVFALIRFPFRLLRRVAGNPWSWSAVCFMAWFPVTAALRSPAGLPIMLAIWGIGMWRIRRLRRKATE